ncbi:MAG: acetyl-CoA carboxylase biotin carboxyl carrier protein subunit, partial [Ilumatobacteraceae bacterium]
MLIDGARATLGLVGDRVSIESPLQGTAVAVSVRVGDAVCAGQVVVLLESMKMVHDVKVGTAGIVADVLVAEGDTVMPGHVLCIIDEHADIVAGEPAAVANGPAASAD